MEAALRALPGVRDAAVVPQRDSVGGRTLAAFYESDDPLPTPELRKALHAVLPHYMVPARLTRIDTLPLNANGKVDRSDLASRRSRQRPQLTRPYRAVSTEIEAWLTGLWEDVLGIDGIGVDDGLFELGGHSLLAARITTAISGEYGVVLEARGFYEDPTIAGTATAVRGLIEDAERTAGGR
nr:phosphopantetheine-binding protein [Actinospica robiniae]